MFYHIRNLMDANMLKKLREKFESKVIRTVHGCWGWITKGCTVNIGTKIFSASRLSWLFYKGPIPENMNVCHSCNHKSCTNPDHLVITKTSHINYIGDKNPRALLTNEQVIQIKKLLNEKVVVKDIAAKYNVRPYIIYSIKHKKSWKNV